MKKKLHVLSSKNLEAMKKMVQLNEKGKPFAWGRDTNFVCGIKKDSKAYKVLQDYLNK